MSFVASNLTNLMNFAGLDSGKFNLLNEFLPDLIASELASLMNFGRTWSRYKAT
jgi:hypothetical protein